MSFIVAAVGTAALIANQYNKNQQDTANKRAASKSNEVLNTRLDYQIPDELKKAYGLAQSNAYGTPDIESRLTNVANRTLGQQLSNNSRLATSGSEAQLGANSAVQNYNQGLDQAAIAGTQQHQQNLQSLYNLSNEMANQRQTQFEFNQQYPVQQRLAFLNALNTNQLNSSIANNTAQMNILSGLGSGLIKQGSGG